MRPAWLRERGARLAFTPRRVGWLRQKPSQPAAGSPHQRENPISKSKITCSACDAVCCRLTVAVLPGDEVPSALVTRNEQGVPVMAKGEDGWCIAVDRNRMCCSIYAQRPAICRKFAMGSQYCRAERAAYDRLPAGTIPIRLSAA